MEHNPSHHDDVDELRRATTAGTPVVLLAHEDPDTGELIAPIEGFITSCEDGPLLGWTGSLGRWSTLETLDDLVAELRSPEPIAPCGSEAGAPTDLSVEPSHWLAYGTYQRWQDVEGCDVRIDVITHRLGSDHCGWEAVEFIVIGDPLGSSIGREQATDGASTYVWDPTGALGTDDRADRRTSLRVEDLPPTAADTGYRQGTAQLWLDPSDRGHLYRVDAGWANRFLLDEEQTLLCL